MIGIGESAEIKVIGDNVTFEVNITFPTFESSNIVAFVEDANFIKTNLALNVDYTLSKIGIPNFDAKFTLVDAGQAWLQAGKLKSGYNLYITFNKEAYQPAKFRDLGRYSPEVLEKTLDRLTMNMLALKATVDRAVTLSTGGAVEVQLPPLAGNANKIIQVNNTATGFEYGVTSLTILGYRDDAQAAAAAALVSQNAAATSATNSANSATASATSATNSANSATASATSATNSANSAAAALTSEQQAEIFAYLDKYIDIRIITVLDSPYNVDVVLDKDVLFLCDTSGGPIVFNLPDITGTPVSWKVGAVKYTVDGNNVTINPLAPDTVNGGSSEIISSMGVGAVMYAESPSDWNVDFFTSSVSATSGGGSLPSGGLTGDILVKNSATNGDVSWQPDRSIINALIFG